MIVSPGPGGTLRDEYGNCVEPPVNWKFLPAGDAGITRKITAQGVFWRVQFKKGRRIISKGVWAPANTIANAKTEVTATRSTDTYKKRMEHSKTQRDRKQRDYEISFFTEVRLFLSFAPIYQNIEKQMAQLITKHAIPIGSGTVARTSLIPIETRAARAVIAWMRHQTTAYDSMKIPRIKGKRREIRRILAEHSRLLLRDYRSGGDTATNCPLKKALSVF